MYIYICIYIISLSFSSYLSSSSMRVTLLVTAKEDRRRFPSHPRHERPARSCLPLDEAQPRHGDGDGDGDEDDDDAREPTVSVALLTVLGRSSDCYATRSRVFVSVRVPWRCCACVRQSAAIVAAAANQSVPCIGRRVSPSSSRADPLSACASTSLFTTA